MPTARLPTQAPRAAGSLGACNHWKGGVKALQAFEMKVVKLQGTAGRGGPPIGKPASTFMAVSQAMGSLATTIDSADSAPTPAMDAAFHDSCHDLVSAGTQWNKLMTKELPAINSMLATEKISALPAGPVTAPEECQSRP